MLSLLDMPHCVLDWGPSTMQPSEEGSENGPGAEPSE